MVNIPDLMEKSSKAWKKNNKKDKTFFSVLQINRCGQFQFLGCFTKVNLGAGISLFVLFIGVALIPVILKNLTAKRKKAVSTE